MTPPRGQTVPAEELDELEVVDAEVVEDDAVTAAAPPRPRLLDAGHDVPVATRGLPARAPVPRAIARARALAPVVARAATVAAGGFAVGAVSMAVARHSATRRIGARRGARVHGLPVAGTRTFVVDVHLVDRDRLRR